MNENNLEEKIKKLEEQVNNFSNNSEVSKKITNTPLFLKLNTKYYVYCYVAVPIVIFIILFIWSPKIITRKISIDGEIPKKKLSFKKLLIATIISTLLILSPFFYRKIK